VKTFHCLLFAALCLCGTAASLLAAAPTVIGVQPAPGTVTALTEITVTFSEPVANVAPGDLLANGLPAAEVSGGGAVYTFTLAGQPAFGAVQISWDAVHNITDLAEPPNRFDEAGPGATWQYNLLDIVPPALASLAPVQGISVRSLTQIEVSFSEAVAGVDAGDLLINGSPASGLSVLGVGKYRFTFPQPTVGTVQVRWADGHGIRDFAATPNVFAGGAWTYALDPNLGLPSIRINEFLASNLSGLADEDVPAEPQDWIELWNYGATPVNLNGYSLTDDPDDPGKWVFPSTNLAAGQFLVVFASEKNRRAPTNPAHRFHTSFQLSAGGEYLALFNAESPRVAITEFAPEYPEQRNNTSYGYDAAGALKYFSTPTPGAANGSSAIAGVLAPPHFNVERGLFDQPFTLMLSSSQPGVTLRYTTDGTEPTVAAGLVFTGPISITNTTVVRAAAFGPNALPSVTVTHSYLFLEQIVAQPVSPAGFPANWGCCGNVNDVSATTTFPPASTAPGIIPADYAMDQDPLRVDPNNTNSPIDAAKLQRLKDGLREMPTLSIVMKTDDIFGVAGLYQRSADETGSSGTKPDNKKPCSIEMILPDGSTAFATTCGIDLHGNASRNPIKNPKHGFKLHFRGDFGPGTLQYRLFEDSPVEEYDDVLLRADFNSSWRHWSDTAGQGLGAFQRTRATRTRDAWMKNSVRDMGGLASHSRFVHLYLNGLYWGTYDFSEDPRDVFAKNALGGTEKDFDLIDQGVLKGGTIDAYNAMRNLPAATTLPIYEQYFQYLNIAEFADYMLLHFFMGHQDWATSADGNKNWAAIRKRVAGQEGVFHYQAWDGECILLNEDINRTTVAGGNYPTGLHGDLDDSPEYRLVFADRVHRHMLAPGGALTQPANIARWQKWQAVLDKAIVAESCRWGDYRRDVHQYQEGTYQLYTREGFWVPENTRMVNSYFPNRNAIVLGQLRTAGLYPTVSAPVLNQQGGYVPQGFGLTMTATNAIYYTLDGTDPRVYGTSAVSPGAQIYSGAVTLNGSAIVKARARFGTNWSALNEAVFTVDALGSPLRLTEIMYNPIGGDAYEFLELQNVTPTAINIGHYSIDGLNFAFAPNTVLAPGQVIVLGSLASPANWNARYPGVTAFARYDGRLDNGGEKLAIRDPAGKLLWSVDYDDANGWPTAADGGGASLEIIDAFGDPDDPANWRASVAANGTPGTLTPPPGQGAVVINEVMAENGQVVPNGGFYPDWLELRNTGAQSVDLTGWSLTDDSNPRKFVFPANTTLAAGGYLVIWCDTNSLVPGLRAPFGLGRNGDTVLLYDANTNRADAVGFGIQLPTHTIGRIAGAWQLNQPTPGAANAAAITASTSNLAINEWLANAVPGGDDWVELYNRAATPVALRGIYLSTSNALHQLNALSFIAPGGYVQLLADENSGANHLDFNLPAAGGALVLHSESGAELDRVTYGAQAQGVSQGRLPDGNASVVNFPASQSPAASNYLLSYNGPILNEVLAINDAAVTNASGRTADFVELRNPNSAPFDLSGMRLSNDPENAAQWTFPAGVSIPANGYLVVWFDNELPASTLNGPVLNTGQSLDGESGEVWLFNSAGQPVDSVVFGFQIADHSLAHFPLPIGDWQLAIPTPGAANSAPVTLASAAGLRINEWSANPATGSDWFELYNPASQPVSLAGLYLSDNPSLASLTQFPLAPLSYIGARGFVRCIADADRSQGRHHVNFNLDGEGEALRIASPTLGVIDTVSFGAQAPGVSQGRLPDGSDNIEEFPGSATPADSNYRPLPNAVINEVLTHTDSPLEDAIEIYNPSGQGIDLSGWFLSDSASDPKKYRIPDGTFLPAGGYRVFYAAQFNSGGPGSFTLDSAGGDQVLLSEADAAGNLSGRRAVARFGAAANGVSFGRFETCHGTDFAPMSARTFGQDAPASLAQFRAGTGLFNADPKVGPVVINELMYHPPGPANADNSLDEYAELHNFSASPVALHDPANPANTWRLRGGVSFVFPQSVTLAAGGYLLVVSFDPAASPAQLAAFRATYGIPAGVPVHGPYSGKLDNGGERVELLRPDTPQAGTGFVPHLLVDRVEYGDSAPWPIGGDGDGASLQRGAASEYGNDAANWIAAGPTAGRANAPSPARAPSIIAQPIRRAVSAGSRVVFSVSVCGSGPLTYQWKFNDGNIANATNALHIIASAQAGNVGNYTVLISNGAGGVLSDAASLALMDLPVITVQPQSQTLGGGLSATFTVEATGAGPLTYQWRRNGIALPGATNATLTLAELRRHDAGAYSVLVSNPAGIVASAVATLTVLVPPTITLQPQSQVVNTNTTVTFTVAAQGAGPVRYQWQFNGANLAGATGATLTLNNVTLAHEGDYRVLVTDDITTGASQVARLTVRVPPVILVGLRGVTNAVGANITLSVTASGSVPMGFSWRKGSLTVTNIVRMTTNSTFTLFNAQTNDSAVWRCIITNSGNATPGVLSQATILILAPPVLTNLPVSQAVEPGANVTFNAGAAGSGPLRYQWQFLGSDLADATNTSLTLSNVQLANQGEYRVTVTNLVGSATAAATLTVGTPVIKLQDVEWLGNGSVRLKLSGVPNRNHVIEISSNLTHWTALDTLFYTNGLVPMVDGSIGGVTNRFYRARLAP
jgi:hypothetical protein